MKASRQRVSINSFSSKLLLEECVQNIFNCVKMNSSRAQKILNLVVSPGLEEVPLRTNILEVYESMSSSQISDISPEACTPCTPTYTELKPCAPISVSSIPDYAVDIPGSSTTTINIGDYLQTCRQDILPTFNSTIHSDESYISGSDDDVYKIPTNMRHQSQVKDLLWTKSIANELSADNLEIIPNPDINDSDSDRTYIPESDESHKTIRKRPYERQQIISESSTASENNVPEFQKVRSSRKRIRRPGSWKCNIRKNETLSGKKHISKNGKPISAKSQKQPCICRKKCFDKITEENRKNIFKLFWDANKTWDQKRQFILTCIKEKATERQRIRSKDGVVKKKRDKTRLYNFIIDNDVIEVCQKYFLNTLGISVTFVTNALKKSSCGMTLEDKRGKKEPANKIKEQLKNTIRKHIEELPKYESHYCREKTKREYLGSHLTIEKLYSLYKENCEKNSEKAAKIWLYRHIFNAEFNIGFKPPQTDTCDDCDHFEVQIKESQGEKLEEIKQKRNKHLEEAGNRYKLKAEDKAKSILSNSEKLLTVDLQKCLPTPLLTNGQTFYLRKLWTLNYTILDSTNNNCTCVMWDESKAGRGGNELASGLMKWFLDNVAEDVNIKKVTIWSDNCTGQNKNMHLFTCYLWLLKHLPHLDVIEHKYLLKGHTHMEVDGIHSLIERHKNRQRQFSIATPWDWQQVVRSCSSTKLPINVINMEVEDFKNFGQLHDKRTSPFIHRKKGTNGQSVQYMAMVWIRMDKNEYGTLQYKTNFEDNAFQKVSLIRNQRVPCSSIPTPSPVRTDLNPISTKKYEDLQKSLPWIPQIFHIFYKNLPHAENQGELEI